jgi:hypothetical protein
MPALEHGGRLQGAAIVGDSSDGKENREVVIGNAIVIPEDELKKSGMSRLPMLEGGGVIESAEDRAFRELLEESKRRESPRRPDKDAYSGIGFVLNAAREAGMTVDEIRDLLNGRPIQEGHSFWGEGGRQGVRDEARRRTELRGAREAQPYGPGNPYETVDATLSRLPKMQDGGIITSPYAGAAPAYTQAPTTQDELIRLARLYSPPAVNNILSGAGEMTRPLDTGQRIASPRQLMRLTEDEGKAMGTRLAAEGSSMGDYVSQVEQSFGPTRSVGRGRLVR